MVTILYSYDEIIAKTNETSLERHSLDSFKVIDILLDSNEQLLKNWSKLVNVDLDSVQKNLKKATYFHDFGKASDKWQLKAHEKIKDDSVKLPPHAFYSGYFISKNMDDPEIMLSVLSIASHHSLLTENSLNSNSTQFEFDENYLAKLANEKGFKLNRLNSLEEYLYFLKNFKKHSQNLQIRSIFEKKKPINIIFKAKYCLMLSYLTIADGLSSDFEENNEKISKKNTLTRFPSSDIIYNKIENIALDKKFTNIQKKIINIKNSNDIHDLVKPILMEAPCGEGKTLASLLFSKILFKNNIINRVIFALPTQVTSNNMFTEFNDEYNIPKDWIGIYHSEILSFLSNLKDEEGSEFFDNVNIEKFNNLIYSKPFNISTIDHLLLSLVNGFKFAPRAFGNMLNSLVIIDELHYYDSRTILLIECLCEVLRFLKVPHVIMSATIPKHVKNKFKDENYLKIQSSGCDSENIEKNPFEFKYHDNVIFEDGLLSDDFLNLIENNIDKNIGIIVNTVPTARKIYDEINSYFPNKQLLLYHSQFMKKDRPIKEKILKIFSKVVQNKKLNDDEKDLMKKYGYDFSEKFIFIGTQVAEISINMSFDIILSELAPLDALIQRGGRLHRSKTYNNVKECECPQCCKLNENHEYIFHVFDTGEFCYPYLTKDDIKKDSESYKINIIKNTKNVIINSQKFTFKNSISMMNQVYDKNSFSEDFTILRDYKEKIREDLIFGKSPTYSEENGGQLRIQTREINVQNQAVLPQIIPFEEFYEYCKNKHLNDLLYELVQFGGDLSVKDFLNLIFNNYSYNGEFTTKGSLIISDHMINISNNFYHSKDIKSKPIHNIKNINSCYSFNKGLFSDNNFL